MLDVLIFAAMVWKQIDHDFEYSCWIIEHVLFVDSKHYKLSTPVGRSSTFDNLSTKALAHPYTLCENRVSRFALLVLKDLAF